MKYDYKDNINKINGFYEWNKNHFVINKKDKRYEKNIKFKKENGFYLDECWNLYTSISIFIIPRLKYYRKKIKKLGMHPIDINSNEEWISFLDKMIWSFEETLKDNIELPKKYRKKRNKKISVKEELELDKQEMTLYNKDIEDGIKLFGKYFLNLWW